MAFAPRDPGVHRRFYGRSRRKSCSVGTYLGPPLNPQNNLALSTEMEAKWTPSSPEERSYYDRLFMLADASKVGRLAGQSAVGFLGKSGLPFPILKEVSSFFDFYLIQNHTAVILWGVSRKTEGFLSQKPPTCLLRCLPSIYREKRSGGAFPRP